MEITFVKLSRPLLIREDRYRNPYYKTVYGFVVERELKESDKQELDDYVGYLAALQEASNGSNLLYIDFVYGSSIYWRDNIGSIHAVPDAWTRKIGQQCSKKLSLTYTTYTLDVDGDYSHCINEENLVICQYFFDELEDYLAGLPSDCFKNAFIDLLEKGYR